MTLPSYDDALRGCLVPVEALPAETVGLADARARVLRHDVIADRDQPPFDRATMDGFAVVGDSPLRRATPWPISGTVAAGQPPEGAVASLAPGTVARIATGAAMMPGADAVVPVEQTTSIGTDAASVTFNVDGVPAGSNVHRRGSDARRGDVVISAGTRLGPHHLGIAATVGAIRLDVTRQIRVSILTSGDEIVSPGTPTSEMRSEQIRNSNGSMVAALMTAIGARVEHVSHAADEPGETLAAARRCLDQSDVVISTGGVSVGHKDWLASTWDTLGMEALVRGAAIQPGKPIVVGCTCGERAVWVVGLPGNPVSVLATAHLFLWPIMRKLEGDVHGIPWVPLVMAEPMRCRAARQLFRAVRRDSEGRGRPVPWHGSGDLMHLAGADGLVRLPRRDGTIEAGDTLPYLPLIG